MFSTFALAQVQNVTFDISPAAFNEDELITITVSGLNRSTWSLTPDNVNDPDSGVYLWMWRIDGSGQQDSATNGQWTDSDESQRMAYNSASDEYTFQLTPDTFFGTTGITQIGMLVKANDGSDTGSGERKSQDNLVDVGRVVLELVNPNSDTVIADPSKDFDIRVRLNTAGSPVFAANYQVFLNNTSVAQAFGCGTPTCLIRIPQASLADGEVRVVGTNPSTSDSAEGTFDLVVAATNNNQALPSASLEDGINYDDADPTKATLVLSAPEKDYVMVAGSFNNYTPDASYTMNYDATAEKFWLELTGLTSGQVEHYQYWVYEETPITDSPTLVKTADPFSTLVLSPFDDPFIPNSTYPNIPTYPAGQEREVTVLQTGQTPYNWQVNNFVKPVEEDLIVYEVLVRDFDANRNYQDLIDRIDYFKNLNINAIQLMPVMEFEGNESWGYNTSFHMALDKFYGTEAKFKEFIDTCHQNGIAVILDVAFNHAFGRNPMVRMWMDDPDGDGWGEPSSENPYFHEVPQHDYNVGSDFDHHNPSNTLTRDYVKRVVRYWIEEFRIDGFRWDLTKGFTNNCGPGSVGGCTDQPQADRVAVLQEYADHSWSIDPDHYVIFEHLGQNSEEQQWADYRLGEGKGIMMWGKMTDPYNQLSMGYDTNADISGIGHTSRGFAGKRLIGYPESHDEERLMYKNVQFGNSTNSAHDVKDLNTALSRMSAIGAVSLLVPGPKMIWHFGELGMENSIFTCPDGSVNDLSGNDGDCKLDTKPQPQWSNNWLTEANRSQIYNDWARMNALKINEDVFEGNYQFIPQGNDRLQRIYIENTSLPATELKDVVILANFDVVTQNITANFPYTGTWYDLMDETGNTSMTVNSTGMQISLAPGEFRVYGNEAAEALSNDEFTVSNVVLYPNPANVSFQLENISVERVAIYSIGGRKVKAFDAPQSSYDVSGLSQGIYFVEILNTKKQRLVQKLVVN